MSGPLSILQARAALYRRAGPTRAHLHYLRATGLALPSLGAPDPIDAACGVLAVTMVRALGHSRFELAVPGDDTAIPAAVIEAFGRDGETTVDLLAWPLDRPAQLLTMFGAASMLGLGDVYAAAYGFGPLRVWRSPLNWLRAGGRGAVVIDPAAAARELLDAPGQISGEDRQHSEELARLVQSLVDRRRFVAPRSTAFQDAA